MEEKKTKVMIACGGTGGHLFPGVAIAQALVEIRPKVSVVFASGASALEHSVLSKTKFPSVSINQRGIRNSKGCARLVGYAMLPASIIRSLSILRNERPDIFIGLGGYAAGPLTLVSALLHIPTVIVEPNAIAGFTNRLLGRLADRVYTGFAECTDFFQRRKTIFAGNPIRQEILAIKRSSSAGLHTIFCFGGSQGALALNRAVVSALPHLISYRTRLRFIHQVGEKEDIEAIRRAYVKFGFEAEVFAFAEHIWDFYAKADLVISRAGAATVAEVAALGLPAIFIPYPHSKDDHQRANAESLVRRDGAVMILEKDLSGEKLAHEIIKAGHERLAAMSAAAIRAGRPNAARMIADDCLKLANTYV